jgi:predicted ATP-dependent serine protease
VLAGMEGQRPMLIEIQALVAPSSLGTPRRSWLRSEPASDDPRRASAT